MTSFMRIRGAVAVGLLFLATACGGTPTEPDPIYPLKTESYGGTLPPGEAAVFHFEVVNPGLITITITSLSPTAVPMGLDLGYWEATTETCQVQASSANGLVNIPVAANPDSPGEYCVGISDVNDQLQAATVFTLVVTHY
jgi:hypothetical protein